jgi:hypothetical protein
MDDNFGALDAKTRASCADPEQYVGAKQSSQKWSFHQNGLSDCPIKLITARWPVQTVSVDNGGVDVRKIDDFLALRFVQLRYSIPSVFDRRNIEHQPENNNSRTTARSRAR